MNKLKSLALLLSILFLSSCSNKLGDDVLSGHLLMGPFTTTALSGDVVSQKLESLVDAADEELIKGYKDIFALPYRPQNGEEAKAVLSKDYNATDKMTSENAIRKLLEQSKSRDYKAYTYSRAVNVANLAYAAGFLTEKEVAVYEQKVLKEAGANYSDWDQYLSDFLKGRKSELKEDPSNSQEVFEIVVNELLLKKENSPYLKLSFPTS